MRKTLLESNENMSNIALRMTLNEIKGKKI